MFSNNKKEKVSPTAISLLTVSCHRMSAWSALWRIEEPRSTRGMSTTKALYLVAVTLFFFSQHRSPRDINLLLTLSCEHVQAYPDPSLVVYICSSALTPCREITQSGRRSFESRSLGRSIVIRDHIHTYVNVHPRGTTSSLSLIYTQGYERQKGQETACFERRTREGIMTTMVSNLPTDARGTAGARAVRVCRRYARPAVRYRLDRRARLGLRA
jgi:hypothetical protein